VPKLHPITGLAACGTAGGRISYGSRSGEQFVLCDGGCSFWLNADEIAYLGPLSGSWATPGKTAPQAVNIHTGARRPLEQVPEGAPLREASFLAASPTGRWQAAIAGAPGSSFGSCGEFPGGTVGRAMTDGRGAASADGSIVLVDLYQGGGQGFRISRPDGVIVPTFNPPADRQPAIAAGSDPYHLELVDAARALWPSDGAWGVHGITPPPLWIPGSLRACYVEIAGVAYLVHWLEGVGTVARRADSDQGKVLSRAGMEFHYDAIAWNDGIRIAWARFDGEPPGSLEIVEWDLVSGLEDLTPAPPLVFPSWRFSHPVSVYPYKAAGSGRPDLFTLGTYTEKPDLPSPMPAGRLLLAHDGESDWTIPAAALRSYDAVGWELYRIKGETLEQTRARWIRQSRANLAQWPRDCFVVPMFYNQFNPETGAWLWTDAEVLEALEYVDQVVNLDPRIKFMAPFSFDRANGIKPNPNLRRAFDDCVAAAALAGEATLTPIPPIIPPIDPPKPDPSLYYKPKEYAMSAGEEIGAVKVGPLFGRVVAAGEGRGPFGWYEVLFDRETPDDDSWWKLTKPDTRHALEHTKIPCLLGADQLKAEDSMFYGKPTNLPNARGILESPVLIKDPASNLLIGYFTWPDRHPTGGTGSPSFVWVKRAS